MPCEAWGRSVPRATREGCRTARPPRRPPCPGPPLGGTPRKLRQGLGLGRRAWLPLIVGRADSCAFAGQLPRQPQQRDDAARGKGRLEFGRALAQPLLASLCCAWRRWRRWSRLEPLCAHCRSDGVVLRRIDEQAAMRCQQSSTGHHAARVGGDSGEREHCGAARHCARAQRMMREWSPARWAPQQARESTLRQFRRSMGGRAEDELRLFGLSADVEIARGGRCPEAEIGLESAFALWKAALGSFWHARLHSCGRLVAYGMAARCCVFFLARAEAARQDAIALQVPDACIWLWGAPASPVCRRRMRPRATCVWSHRRRPCGWHAPRHVGGDRAPNCGRQWLRRLDARAPWCRLARGLRPHVYARLSLATLQVSRDGGASPCYTGRPPPEVEWPAALQSVDAPAVAHKEARLKSFLFW